jgi:hypothetical protein
LTTLPTPFETREAFKNLQALLASPHPPLALIGSGASMGSGYPRWSELIDEMAKLAGPKANIPKRAQALSKDLIWAAEAHARDMGAKKFAHYIRERFGPPAVLAQPHPTLAAMPFRHFLTTNYDPCIELALRAKGEAPETVIWDQRDRLSNFLINLARPIGPRSVVYLHGHYTVPSKIILTESSYVDRYVANDDARRKLLAIFMTHPVMFVGFSMDDPDFANLMREVTARLQTKPPCHYALLDYGTEPEREVYRERMRGKFGVEPVFYKHAEGADKHANLLALLQALTPKFKGAAPSLTTSSPQTSRPRNRLDPEKGQWGGQAIVNGRRLRVVKTGGSRKKGLIYFDLVVDSLRAFPELTGDVVFHLHPTFDDPVVVEPAVDGRARLETEAYGAFTVGVSCDNGATKLELDLAQVKTLPEWFRRR